MVGDGGDGGARGVRRASDAAAVNLGEAFRQESDEDDELGDVGTRASMSKIVTSLLDRAEFDDDGDELVDRSDL